MACFFRRALGAARSEMPLVALAPVPLLAANSYGGEMMIFRVYLFALPAMAFPGGRAAAAPRLPSGPAGCSRCPGLLLVLLGGLFFAYDSKEKMNCAHPARGRRRAGTSPLPRRRARWSSRSPATIPGLYANYDRDELVLLSQAPATTQSLLVDGSDRGATQQALVGTTPGASTYLLIWPGAGRRGTT